MARRFLAEGMVLTGLALLAGGALSVVGLRALLTLAPPQLLGRDVVGLDAWVLLFAAATSALIGIGCGLLPTLQARRVDVQSTLKEGRSQAEAAAVSKLFMRRCLVAGQTALAVVLLVAAALLIGTLRNLQGVDPGFRADNVLRADLQLPDSRYPREFQSWPNWPERRNFYSSLLERVRALPGVRTATLTSQHPLQAGFTNSFGIVGIPYDSGQGEITIRLVSPTYFDTVGATLLHGRLMDTTDDARSEPVAIINEAAPGAVLRTAGAARARAAVTVGRDPAPCGRGYRERKDAGTGSRRAAGDVRELAASARIRCRHADGAHGR